MGRIKDLTNINQVPAQGRFGVDNTTSVNSITFTNLANQLITAYGGADLGGTPRSVKSAIDALASALNSTNAGLASTSTNVTFTLGTVTATVTIRKWGKVCSMTMSLGSTTGTPFAEVDDNPVIATLPEGYRPAGSAIMYCTALGRTVGGWASADYYHFVVGIIPSSGNVQLFGKTSNLRSCRFISFGMTWITS